MNKFQVNIIHHYHKFPQPSVVKPVVSNATPSLSQLPLIELPFPPTIRASDIAQKRLRSRICSKSPNAFFVYRKAFVDQLAGFGGNNKLKMTEVSRLVSSRWKRESKLVKEAYEEIAKQVEKELNDIRNKDLVYTDDFNNGNGGRRKTKNRKRGRKSNSGFGSDAFFLSLKGGNANFNISTLDFSVKPDSYEENNMKSNSSPNSSYSSETSITECDGSVNSEESSSSDESSVDNQTFIPHFNPTVNAYNDHFQQLQQQDSFQVTSQYYPISEVGLMINSDLNLLTPSLDCDSELNFCHQNEYNSLLKDNEFSTSSSYTCHDSFENRDLEFYLGYYDSLL
ncbi:20046_t:CDS:2 [Funneliformis geosporum]|uniref:20046_t:CDS:1 n=1 Tax=Funneliformis geosporum TaxID=1117311 RepID=A0A9W4SAN5_9GLOM|nr:20046_t:CDS:2 [Funneliformis geosporum]